MKIAWDEEDGRLRFSWREIGGPAVAAPTRRGFGTRLLERAIAHDLAGFTRLDYAQNGLCWDATAPLRR